MDSFGRGCFVTGTDTGVGKTAVSAALLHVLGKAGFTAAGFKPVATGLQRIDGKVVNEDVLALHAAGTAQLRLDEVGPFQFELPCAPHIAARAEGRSIDRVSVLDAVRSLIGRSQAIVVEGVGGFVVPLGDDWDTSDLACALGLPVILVVGMRLGCINHALLTAEAVGSRGLTLAGWVANVIDPCMIECEQNVAALRHELQRRHSAPCLGVVPWLRAPGPSAVAECLDATALTAALCLASRTQAGLLTSFETSSAR